MAVAVVRNKGLLELPEEVQRALDLHVGDQFEVRVEGNLLQLRRKTVDILDLAGRFASGKIATDEEIEQSIQDGWADIR